MYAARQSILNSYLVRLSDDHNDRGITVFDHKLIYDDEPGKLDSVKR